MKIYKYILPLAIFLLAVSPVLSKSKSPEKYNQIGFECQKQALYDRAIENYEQAISVDAHFFPACNNMGTVYYLKGDYESAVKYFKKAVNIKPDSYAAHYSLGVALLNLYSKHYKDKIQTSYNESQNIIKLKICDSDLLNSAVEHLKLAVKINNDSCQAHTALGIAYLKQNDHDKAVNALSKALSVNDKYPIANYHMGLALKLKSDLDCIKYFKKTVSLDPAYTKAYIELGMVLMSINRYEEAVLYANKAMKNYNNPESGCNSSLNMISLSVSTVDSAVFYKKIGAIDNLIVFNTYKTPVNEDDKQKLTHLISLLGNL